MGMASTYENILEKQLEAKNNDFPFVPGGPPGNARREIAQREHDGLRRNVRRLAESAVTNQPQLVRSP